MFRIDKRLLYILLGVMIFKIILNCVSDASTALDTLLIIPAVLIAITFHEFAHAFAAYKLGDNTAKQQGRMNLNPLSHIDPIGLIMLLTIGIGWGKPVQVDYRNFRKDISVAKAEAIVSIAGPIMNFILAIVFAVLYALILRFGWLNGLGIEACYYIMIVINYVIMLNIGLGVFNLIPLPPLDGSKVLKFFLPTNARMWFEQNEYIFYIVFIIAWITGIASSVISPIINFLGEQIINLMNFIINI